MPAHDFEVEEALQEGVMIKWLSTISQAGTARSPSRRWRLDAEGQPQPPASSRRWRPIPLVLALGQDVDLSLLEGVPASRSGTAWCRSTERMMTGHAGIFAGGDMVPAERNVTVAVGHGKKAARHIDAWLRGSAAPPPEARRRRLRALNPGTTATRRRPCGPCSIWRRQTSFDEVQGGLTGDNAQFEARRCLSCGNCFECDNCYGVCPDNAVIKLGRAALPVQLRLLQGSAVVQNAAVASLLPGWRSHGAALPLLTGLLIAYLPWVVGAGWCSRWPRWPRHRPCRALDWARRAFIGLLVLAIVFHLLGLWFQHEVPQSVVESTLKSAPLPEQALGVFGGFVTAARTLGVALTLAACALLGWIIRRLMSAAVVRRSSPKPRRRRGRTSARQPSRNNRSP